MKKKDIYKLIYNESKELIGKLKELIKDGLNINQAYNEDTPLLYAVRLGKIDAIKALIQEGADIEPLEWTNTFLAVVFGSLEDIKKSVTKNKDINQEDYCGRTPWLYAVMLGDLTKTSLLMELGADKDKLGWQGISSLEYSVRNNRVNMLKWLVKKLNYNIESMNCIGQTPLIVAAEQGKVACFEYLLSCGAKINVNDEKAIEVASNMEIVNILIARGEDIKNISCDMRAKLLNTQCNSIPNIEKSKYMSGRYRVYGNTNPENKNVPFWIEMVKKGATADSARSTYDDNGFDKAIWSYERFGRTTTILNDGRIIEIGGEHEDHYDYDFCIYNDVTIFNGDEVVIYSYPKEIFPPTDFHTATFVDNYIYIIGSLGYYGERHLGFTSVYRLDINTYKIEKMDTTGDMPGWIHSHKAYFDGKNNIVVTKGLIENIDEKDFIRNDNEYILNLKKLYWSKF